MECKYYIFTYIIVTTISELIDTLWNVNQELVEIAKELGYELIDTLWNVNQVHYLIIHFLFHELIDTLWNVNSEISHLYFLL